MFFFNFLNFLKIEKNNSLYMLNNTYYTNFKMDTNTISIINFPNPHNIEEIAKWDTLFYKSNLPSNNAPLIELHPLPAGVRALKAVMSAAGKEFEDIWQPFTKEELIAGAQKYWGYPDVPGVFDMSHSMLHRGVSYCSKRPLTRCELILVMKCEYLSRFRLQAIENNFDPYKGMCKHPDDCIKKCENCICSGIPFK
jgi:hypothetical protein